MASTLSQPKYVGAIDQGTSSTRFMIFDNKGSVVSVHQMEHTQHYPQPGWVEHDPLEILKNTKICINEAMNKANIVAADFAAVGVTNQRETTVVWNKLTGAPYGNAIVWNDIRTAHACDKLNKQGYSDLVKEKTGLPIATYFSATKIQYILNKVKHVRRDAEAGNVLFGNIDSWLIWNLTGRQVHATDVTNASRTLLMNLRTLSWDKELLSLFAIPVSLLPAIKSSSETFGLINTDDVLLNGVAISGVLGDQQAALFGQTCFKAGEAKCTFGTGAFLLMNTGTSPVPSTSGLLTTVGYQIGAQAAPVFALEGSIAYSGSVIQWIRDNLGLISSVADSEKLATSVEDNGGVYFVPAFAGLFAPYWRDDARGLMAGLTAYNTSAHIVRAALEANGFQTRETLDAMQRDSALQLMVLKVDGGMTANNFAMQFLSDLVDAPLACPVIAETTALGAAMAAGLAVNFWRSQDELCATWQCRKAWQPEMNPQKRNHLMLQWSKAIDRCLGWVDGNRPSSAPSPTKPPVQPAEVLQVEPESSQIYSVPNEQQTCSTQSNLTTIILGVTCFALGLIVGSRQSK